MTYTLLAFIRSFIPHEKLLLLTPSAQYKIIFFIKITLFCVSLLALLIYYFRKNIALGFSYTLHHFLTATQNIISGIGLLLRQEERIHLLSFLIILCLSTAIRIHCLSLPMGYDESFTFLKYVSKPLYQSMVWYRFPNNHLLHTFLAHLSYLLLGNHPWALRLPAFGFGVLLVVLSYTAARYFFDKNVALLAMGLVGASHKLIFYSCQARGYSMLCVFFLLALLIAENIRRSPSLFFKWLTLSIVCALGFFTLPQMFYPFGLIYFWLLCSYLIKDVVPGQKNFVKFWFYSFWLTIVLTLLLYSPAILVYLLLKYDRLNYLVQYHDIASYLAAIASLIKSIYNEWTVDLPIFVVFLLGTGFVAHFFQTKRMPLGRFSLWAALCVLLVIIHGSCWFLAPLSRTWLFLLPLFFISAAAGIVFLLNLSSMKIKNAVTFLSIIMACYLFWNVYSQNTMLSSGHLLLKDAKSTTLFLKTYLTPEDRVYGLDVSEIPLEYYFGYFHAPLAQLITDIKTVNKNDFHRLILVVSDDMGQTLAGNLQTIPFYSPKMSVKILKRFDASTLYVIDKL